MSTTVVFVPGAWHPSTAFEPVPQLLEKAGLKTESVDLPSVGPAKHEPDFTADVNAIRARVQKAVDAGDRVVVVAHSYGGIPSSEAVKGLDLASRQQAQKKGGVTHMVYLASFLIPEGQSLISAFGGNDLPWFRISDDRTEVNPATPEDIFYNDVDAEAQKKMIAALKPHSYQCFHSQATYAAWKYLPSTYVYCLQDAAIPIAVQKMMVEQTGAGIDIKTDTIDASHSPFLSKPEETAAAIRRVAEAAA